MKTLPGYFFRSAALALLVLAASTILPAQTASSYSGYSTDGSQIYTWVVISGDMTGGTYNHTCYAENLLTNSTNGGTSSVGPTVSGVTLRRNNSVVAELGTEYTFFERMWAYCDFVGPSAPFFDSQEVATYLALKATSYVFDNVQGPIGGTMFCNMRHNCPNGEPACVPTAVVQVPEGTSCPQTWGGVYLAVRAQRNYNWTCTIAVRTNGSTPYCDSK